jgi:hypothetical protein
MYPGFIPHWKRRHCGSGYDERAGMGGGHGERSWRPGWEYTLSPEEDAAALGFGSGAFGVRRPLRFLAYKLGLQESQVAELAKILDDVKTERAQAAVDHRRTCRRSPTRSPGTRSTTARRSRERSSGWRARTASRRPCSPRSSGCTRSWTRSNARDWHI